MKRHDELYKWVGRRIAHHRKSQAWSQSFLAEKIGLSQGSVANIEKGRQQPPLHIIFQIAQVFQLPANFFIPIENEHLEQHQTLTNKIDQNLKIQEQNKPKAISFIESV